MKKILILHTSIGLGHKSIAENIGFHLTQSGYEVRIEDILKIQQGSLVNFSAAVHHFINSRLPFVWRWLYKSELVNRVTLPLRTRLASRHCQNTTALIGSFNPDLIITTQTTASAVIASLKQRGFYSGPLGIAFSDFHLHRYWLYKEADFYITNIEEQKSEMVRLGLQAGKIFECGMTLKPKPQVNTDAVRQRLGLHSGTPVVLHAAGSLGIGIDEGLLEDLSGQQGLKTIVVCGKNLGLKDKLSKKFPAGSNVKIYGFYSPMDELYAIADVFVTKPGGLSVTEALRWQLPIVINHALPGQEEINYDYLVAKGLIMPRHDNVLEQVLREVKTKEFKNSLSTNPALARLDRGGAVVEAVRKFIG